MAQPSQSQYVEQPRFCESCPLCITGKSHPARLPVPSGLHVRASHENLRRLFRSARAAQCVTTKRDPDRSRGLPVSAGYLARTHDPHHQRKGCEDWSGQHPAPSQYYQTKKIPTRRLRLRAASCALPASKPRPGFLINPLLCLIPGCEAADVFHLTIAPRNPDIPSGPGFQMSCLKNRIGLHFIHWPTGGVILSRATPRRLFRGRNVVQGHLVLPFRFIIKLADQLDEFVR